MTAEEEQALVNEYNSLVNQYNDLVRENQALEQELNVAIDNVYTLIGNTEIMDQEVNRQMAGLSGKVDEADLETLHIFEALTELTNQYFIYKNLSTASKNLTQYTDEYNTRFFFYHELRRITLGFVIGLDANLISQENLRKKVEKAYLQNTDYWLAYAAASVTLWASDEREAAERAMSRSLTMDYYKSAIFYLLINLRFGRQKVARDWYLNYLDKVDTGNMGDEWQYLLQAYLSGAFGSDPNFQKLIVDNFTKMIAQVQVSTVDFGKKVADRAMDYAITYLHRTEHSFAVLCHTCKEYDELRSLLSEAEKNIRLVKHYEDVLNQEPEKAENIWQRIENVLYDLINSYDDEEKKVVKNIKYNEAVIGAKGDASAAQKKFNSMFEDDKKKKTLGDLLLRWAFTEDMTQTDVRVKNFSISFMKDWIIKGYEQFADIYRPEEKERVTIEIGGCEMYCDENEYHIAAPILEKYYEKNKKKNILADKQVKIYILLCFGALLILIITAFTFSPVGLTLGILAGLAGSFLLWRRIVDMGKILVEKKRKALLRLQHALEELGEWRRLYHEQDDLHGRIKEVLDLF